MLKTSAPIVRKPENKDNDDAYIVRISFSSPEEDLHHTRMGMSSLDNFLRQVNRGEVAICPNHVKECPIGKASNATRDEKGILYCDAELDRDLPLIHPEAGFSNSDVIIRQIEANRIQKTSIGAYGGEMRCNIDGKDMLVDFGCWHWPGVTYNVKVQEEGDKLVEKDVRCVPVWENLNIGEISAVWTGSNLQSEILNKRAGAMLDSGLLDKSTTLNLNKLFNYNLDVSRAKPDKTIIDLGANGGGKMTPELEKMKQELEAANEALKQAEAERDALKQTAETLALEENAMRQNNIASYKTLRADSLTGDELKDYEEKQTNMNLQQLRTEEFILNRALGSSPEEKQLHPGRKTKDVKNNSVSDDIQTATPLSVPVWAQRNRGGE